MSKGRRPGNPQTRQQILDAARELFGRHGYDGASMRAIAAAARVDVALVSYHFGSKSDLFAATLELPISPARALGGVLAATRDPRERAERLLRTLLAVWDQAGGGPLAALMRSATSQEQLLRGFLEREMLPLLRAAIDGDGEGEGRGAGAAGGEPAARERDAALRANAIASQMSGLLLVRYVLAIEPLASASHDEIVATVAPALERYLLPASDDRR